MHQTCLVSSFYPPPPPPTHTQWLCVTIGRCHSPSYVSLFVRCQVIDPSESLSRTPTQWCFSGSWMLSWWGLKKDLLWEKRSFKLGAHYTTLYNQLLSSHSQLKTYDRLAHTIQLFCWVVHSFMHSFIHSFIWFLTTRAQRHNSSTSQSLSSLIGAIIRQ